MNEFHLKELFDLLKAREYGAVFIKLCEYGIASITIAQLEKEYREGTFRTDAHFHDRLLLALRGEATEEFKARNTTIDIFFSFSSKNMREAQTAVNELRNAGLSVFFSGEDLGLQIGTTYFGKVQEALAQATHFVLYFSEEAMASHWVCLEYETFFERIYIKNPKERRFFIICDISIDHDKLPTFLQRIQTCKTKDVINLLKQPELEAQRQREETEHLAKLKAILKREQEKAEHQAKLKREQEEAEHQARLKKEQEEVEQTGVLSDKNGVQKDIPKQTSNKLYYKYALRSSVLVILVAALWYSYEPIFSGWVREMQKEASRSKKNRVANREKAKKIYKWSELEVKQGYNKKHGIIHKVNKDTIIDFIYDNIILYDKKYKKNNMTFAKVWIDNKQGIIDSAGKFIVPMIYTYLDIIKGENIIKASLNEKDGIIDINNNIIIPFQYNYLGFYNDYGRVELEIIIAKKNNYWGIINEKNEVIIPIKYEGIDFRGITKGLYAIFAKLNGYWGRIDIKGNVIIPFKYERIGSCNEDGVCIAVLGNKFGYIDNNDKIVIPFLYEGASGWDKGGDFGFVRLNGEWCRINRQQQIVRTGHRW